MHTPYNLDFLYFFFLFFCLFQQFVSQSIHRLMNTHTFKFCCIKIKEKYRDSLAWSICVSSSPRLQHPGREEPGPTQTAEKALQGRLLPCAGLRAGAPLQPPAILVRTGTSGPGGIPEAHRDSGQDLVPKPPVQDETPPDGRRPDGIHPCGQEGRGESFGAGRPETVHPGRDPAAPAAVPAAVLLLPLRLLPPCMDTLCVCRESVRTR